MGWKISRLFNKEVYKIPLIICLFSVPIFFAPFITFSFTQGKEIFFKLTLLATIIAVLIGAICNGIKIRPILKSAIGLTIIILFGITVITDAISLNPIVTLYGTYSRGFGLIIKTYFLIFTIFCANTIQKKDIITILNYAFIGSFIVALYAIAQKIGFDPLFENFNKNIFAGRVSSFLGNPGYLGQFMLLNFILGIFLFLKAQTRKVKVFYALVLASIFITLYLSATRAAFFSIIICGALVAVKFRSKIVNLIKKLQFKKKILIIFAITIIVAAIFALIPKDRFSLSNEALRSLNSRFEIWQGAINLISKRPWFGYGEETFYIHFPETITKKFLTLEEDVNLSADRIHNDLLETVFSNGIFAGIAYLLFFVLLIRHFFITKNTISLLLSLLIIANIVQNQFAFSDITISLFIYFCIGALIATEIHKEKSINFNIRKTFRLTFIIMMLVVSLWIGYGTVYRPLMSNLAYTNSHKYYSIDYAMAVNEHKKAIKYTPYYSELWYELMFIDPSSMSRALHYLEQIEGNSGNVLAWKGNYYVKSNPQKASDYYLQALGKNPHHPNWVRSYADMLYKNGDYENALFLYKKYLESMPDFYKWRDNFDSLSHKEKLSYRIFFKNVPYFWKTFQRIQELEAFINYQKQSVGQINKD